MSTNSIQFKGFVINDHIVGAPGMNQSERVVSKPESGVQPIAQVAEMGRISRRELGNAFEGWLDNLASRVGLLRCGCESYRPHSAPVEPDDPFRNRIRAHAEEWGLFDDDDALPGIAEPPKPEVMVDVFGRGAAFTINANGKPRLTLFGSGHVQVDGARCGPWQELPRMMEEIAGTKWDVRIWHSENETEFDPNGVRLSFGYDGSIKKRSIVGTDLEKIGPDAAAEWFCTTVRLKHLNMRVHRLARALFETDPTVVAFVKDVADDSVVLGCDRAIGVFRLFDTSRQESAFDRAWERDEHGWRTTATCRARDIIAKQDER